MLSYIEKYKYPIVAGLVVIVLIVIGISVIQYTNSKKIAQNPTNTASTNSVQDNKKLVAEVGKLIDLPIGEDPTIATITDIDKLKNQPFFQKAKNGDKVLIYTGARKAILYDPATKKILDVTVINPGTPSAQVASPSAVINPAVKQ